MTRRLRLADPEHRSPQPGRAHLAPAKRDELNLAVGDPIAVAGSKTGAARVGADRADLPPETILLDGTERENVGAAVGDPVTIEPISPVPARTVRVAAGERFSLEGDADTLAGALDGAVLTVGDTVRVRLFGGTVTVTLTVRTLTPSGPAVVDEDTTIETTSPQREIEWTTRNRTQSTLGGLEAEKNRLKRLLVEPLIATERFDALGARPPAGILVTGPSGTGKTELVRTVTDGADLPVIEVDPEDCRRRETVAPVLRKAAADAPGVLFVEALETAAPNPDQGRRESPSALDWLLDQVRTHPSLVVVGEATRPGAVHPALRRGGRFESELRVDVPGPDTRREILSVLGAAVRFGPDVDVASIADRAHGYTGADLEAVLVDAATRAVDRTTGQQPADSHRQEPTVRSKDLEAALDAVDPSTVREVTEERPSVTYQDVGGLDAAKRAVIRTVEWPLRHPELFERLDVAPPTGVLLAGPPGTGKTMLAKAVAHSTDANFLAVNGPELLDRYVGESERGVRSIFERARRGSPSVLFLDEVDALAPARHSTETGATERVVSQLLTELDGLSARGEVAVLAATNRPESVDAAILRPGRIEKRVDVPPPDQSARADILAVHLEDVPTRNVDLEALGKATAGYVGSDLAGVVREAALVAMAEHLRSESAGKTPTSLHLEERHLRSAIEKTTPSVDVTQLDLGRRS